MQSITDLDSLTGQEVRQAFALHDLQFGWLQQVIFQVEEAYLVVSVEEDSDEIILSILTELNVEALAGQFSRTQIANQRKRIGWLWRMTNSRGYDDGFQVEFDDREGTNVQLIAEASQIRMTIFQRF